MCRRTEPKPEELRAAAEYRFALITRDYRRLGMPHPNGWRRRRR